MTIARTTDAEASQERLFDPERYSPCHPDVILRLPAGSARAFWLASVLGRFLRFGDNTERLKSAKEAAGTLVQVRHRNIILKELHIGLRRWEQYTEDWERRYIGHRCGYGTVFLFTHALLDECPACHAELAVDHLAPAPSPRRGRGFKSKGSFA